MNAIENGDMDFAWAILRHPETDLSLRNYLGETALDIAQESGNNEIFALIRDYWVKKFLSS